ncbi:MAG: AEC family transporter [Thermoanaerobacteraceae bacterium]
MAIIKMAEVLSEIFIVMAVGYYIAFIKLVKEENLKMLADLVILISTPLLIFYSMYSTYKPDLLKVSYILPFVSSATLILTLIVSILIFKVFKVPFEKKNVFYALSSFSNTIFLGLPINLALFGDISIPYVILYDFGHTALFWTLGIWILSEEKKLDILAFKKILNPSFIALILSFLIAVSRIKVPEIFLKSAQMIGSITVPLAMLFIGMNMYLIKKGEIETSVYVSAVIKLIISPLIAFMLVYFLNLPIDAKKIAVLEAAMPTMMSVAIVAKQLNVKNSFASFGVVIMNMLSFLTIPMFLVLISVF